MKHILAIIIVSLTLVAQSALALPKPLLKLNQQSFLQLRPSGNLAAANFRAIVALSNCSGSLVRYAHSQGTDRAMVITNGHCLENSFLKPGEVRVNQASTRKFALLNDSGSRFATLTADLVLVATMTHTDITLYRLTETYNEIIQKYNVQPLALASSHPVASTPIAVVSGYWKRVYSCQVDHFVFALREAEWTMRDSIKYTKPGCEVIGGTSGSPIINTNSYEIIGVNNTINENGARCTMDNPCEVDEQGNVTVDKGGAYGQETFWLYGCLNQDRQIDLNQPKCLLRP